MSGSKNLVKITEEALTDVQEFAKKWEVDKAEAASELIQTGAGRLRALAKYNKKAKKAEGSGKSKKAKDGSKSGSKKSATKKAAKKKAGEKKAKGEKGSKSKKAKVTKEPEGKDELDEILDDDGEEEVEEELDEDDDEG